MIQIDNISFARGVEPLVEHGFLQINPNQKIGLIGSNGSGKSTFFDVLLNKVELLTGKCQIPKHWTLAHVSQLIPHSDKSALDFVLEGDKIYTNLHNELAQALDDQDDQAIMRIYQTLEDIDAYRIPAKASELLYGLGFTAENQHKAVNDFSGGWRVRLNLAQALIARSDCLLLDEPTNHLDLSAIIWLENWLKTYGGTVIIIAHDSAFLDAVVDSIAVIENKSFHLYKGNYSNYLTQRAAQLALQQKNHEKQQKAQAHLKKFIDKFKAKASKAKQAQSRMKQLDRMQLIQAVHAQSPFEFHFKPIDQCSNPLLAIDQVSIGYNPATPILTKLNLRLAPSDRIGILGENGAGKSTLIKLLAGELRALSGTMTHSNKLKIGYFSQHQVEQLDLSISAAGSLAKIAPKLSEQAIRTYLGGFGFSGDKAFQQVGTFSGGEKARLTLALIVYQNPHLLLLDEPTNHLDIEMREALSLALQAFEGALVLISHDRQLMSESTEALYLLNEGSLQPFEGDLNDYCQWLANKKRAPKIKKAPLNTEVKPDRTLIKTIEKLEKKIHQLNEHMHLLETKLLDQSLYTTENADALTRLQDDLQYTKQALVLNEKAWLEASQSFS